MNAEVTNALKKNIFVSSRLYKNVLLWFNHEFTQSEHPAKKKSRVQEAASSSLTSVGFKDSSARKTTGCLGGCGEEIRCPPNKGHPSGSLWTRNKPREPSWHRFTRQDIKKRHRASFQPQSCQWELVSKQTDPSGPQAQGGEKPYSSPLLKAVVKKEKKGKSWNRIWDCFSTLKQQQEHELPTQRGSDGWYRGRE